MRLASIDPSNEHVRLLGKARTCSFTALASIFPLETVPTGLLQSIFALLPA